MEKLETKGNTHNLKQSEPITNAGSQVLTNNNVSEATKQSGDKSKGKALSKKEIFDKLKEIENRSDYSFEKIKYEGNINSVSDVLNYVYYQLGLSINELYILFKDNPQCFVHEVNYNTFNALRTKLKGQKDKIGVLKEENMEPFRNHLQEILTKFLLCEIYLSRLSKDFSCKNTTINSGLTLIAEIQKIIREILRTNNMEDNSSAERIFRFTFKENLFDRSEKLTAILCEILQLYSSRSKSDQAKCQEFLKMAYVVIITMGYDGLETDYEKLERIEDEWKSIFNVSSITYWLK